MTDLMNPVEASSSSPKSRTLAATLAILPLSISAIPWGVLCGTLAVEAGLSGLQAQMMSLTMFAGTAQLSGITILAAGGSWLTLINSTSMVNVRYILYSAVYKEEITKLPLYKRLLFAFTMNDFMFAVSEESQLKKGYFDYAYTVTAGLVFYVIWNLSTFLGIFLARFLSDIDSLGFDFVIAATFITIILPMIKTKALLLSVVSSAVFAYLFEYFHIGNGLILSALIGMVVGTLFSKSSNDDDKTEDATTDKAKGETL